MVGVFLAGSVSRRQGYALLGIASGSDGSPIPSGRYQYGEHCLQCQ
jgi:hypothetical protein